MITPVIINRLQWKAYLIFMATNLLFVPAFYFFYPETSNLGLEDIDYIFTEGGNPVTVARRMQKELGPRHSSQSRCPSMVAVMEKRVPAEKSLHTETVETV
jgi:hypothetical protein